MGGLDMNNGRRDFLKSVLGIGAGLLLPKIAKPNTANNLHEELGLKKITILHTNDTHSQIEPLPKNHYRYPGQGGYSRRAYLINQIKRDNDKVFIFDSGDLYQGTPYFNIYKGKLEIEYLNKMYYTAITIGNHEFDLGLNVLGENLLQANFDIISSNYVFTNDPILSKIVKPYKIYNIDKLKIGVFGLGIEPTGLIDKNLWGKTIYKDPMETAAKMALLLKKEYKCNLVICLSHLGYKGSEGRIGDIEIAKSSRNIDIILGGHSHTLLSKPVYISNREKKPVIITQNAYAGVQMTQLDCYFNSFGSFLFAEEHNKKIFYKNV
ncbi:MAG: metallophosphatase [Bacteroidales bacterium]|jgi:5'-nucleotidase